TVVCVCVCVCVCTHNLNTNNTFHPFVPILFPCLSPSTRLTAVEEELLSLAGNVVSQQASVNQLELELEAEEEGIKWGQRVYQFSKRHALEESRQQVMLCLGARTRLEAQRLLLKGKLEWLGSSEPPPALGLEEDRISLSSITSSERDGLRNLSVDGIISHLSGLFKPKYTVSDVTFSVQK
uniref:Uncharacterized protein n=1 Tax=Hucho hucho TaxID=62062 RepID=A0A4W5JRD3_9TELE